MTKRKKALFSVFRHFIPADYEAWFERLAEEGWHPQKIGQWSSIVMNFAKGEPKKYRYVVDMQAVPKKDYIRTYEEFGWELVGRMASSFIWRKEYIYERPESFNDVDSLIERNRRFIWAISFSFAIFTLAALVVSVCFAVNFKALDLGGYIQFVIGIVLSYGSAISLGSIMRKIKKNIDR